MCDKRDPLRGTGRTQRTIERAVCGMLMGQSVLLIMAKQQDVKQAIDYATEWLHRNGLIDNGNFLVSVERTNGVIRFASGKLMVRPMVANVQGLRPALILHDHYAEELLEEKRRKEEKAADLAEVLRLLNKHGYRSVIGSKMADPKFIRHDGGKE